MGFRVQGLAVYRVPGREREREREGLFQQSRPNEFVLWSFAGWLRESWLQKKGFRFLGGLGFLEVWGV